jgi:hypothetical protein
MTPWQLTKPIIVNSTTNHNHDRQTDTMVTYSDKPQTPLTNPKLLWHTLNSYNTETHLWQTPNSSDTP